MAISEEAALNHAIKQLKKEIVDELHVCWPSYLLSRSPSCLLKYLPRYMPNGSQVLRQVL
ncbi:hypothetical protein OsccyDRAFT_3875 [Leptolyngbyaceae cyanobacterium JSC-12]|nr:hypothetical protein OsccyDRAFT_3875 [Leptolyngbyaceae cyanobacterium JSC-12]